MATVRTAVHGLKPTPIGTVAPGRAQFGAQSFFQLFKLSSNLKYKMKAILLSKNIQNLQASRYELEE
jgi:hypothetical protein